jgi:hypothetical protein
VVEVLVFRARVGGVEVEVVRGVEGHCGCSGQWVVKICGDGLGPRIGIEFYDERHLFGRASIEYSGYPVA